MRVNRCLDFVALAYKQEGPGRGPGLGALPKSETHQEEVKFGVLVFFFNLLRFVVGLQESFHALATRLGPLRARPGGSATWLAGGGNG